MDKKMVYPERSRRVFVGMSGGVDSSVAAYLLKKKGYDVVGVFMKCYNLDGCSEKDSEDARRVAEKLDIPFYVWDFEDEYKKKVVDYMVAGYKKGITPNPDVMCNKEIKFGLFFEKAMEMGASFVSTGHYARVKKIKSLRNVFSKAKTWASPRRLPEEKYSARLFEARDKNKDQSYFLWTLTQKQLAKCLFPIGDYLKPEVRKIAKKEGLPTAEKKDSQGICFLGQVSIEDFLKDYIPEKRGDILLGGKKIGKHKGAQFYTIGQRHGLGVAGKNPYYISEKDAKKNIIKIVEGDKHPDLYKNEIYLQDINFINSELEIRVMARVRYRQPLAPAKLIKKGKNYKLVFDAPVKFVAPGQSAVFYSKKIEMLGGGIIK
jgi:tRNA-specific 2-thiouridylase